jgi:hypothetical protein
MGANMGGMGAFPDSYSMGGLGSFPDGYFGGNMGVMQGMGGMGASMGVNGEMARNQMFGQDPNSFSDPRYVLDVLRFPFSFLNHSLPCRPHHDLLPVGYKPAVRVRRREARCLHR